MRAEREIFPSWAVVLLVLLVLLAVSGGLLFHFRHHLISVYKVEVDSGVASVLLPFKTTVGLFGRVTVIWRNNSGRMVDRSDWHYENLQQHKQYEGRTEMKKSYIFGDFSLTLKNPTVRDSGTYTCTVYDDCSGRILAKKQVLLKVKDSLIIAIDFGSGYSSYAFNLKPREEGGETQLKRWGKELGLDSPKTPTCILFDEDRQFLNFGYEAKTAYSNMRREETEKLYFFEDFKSKILNTDFWYWRIKAANNKEEMMCMEVFTEVLRFLKDDALKTIKHHPAGGEISASDFTWVLTVPDRLKDFPKRIMTEAAVQAGLVGEDTKDKLVFALESAAALAWCLKPPPDGFITQNHSTTSQDQPAELAGAGTSCNAYKPRATLTADKTILPAGGSVVLRCSVSSSAGWKYDWFRNGQQYPEVQSSRTNEPDGVLRVSEGGVYSCRGGRGDPAFYTETSTEVTIDLAGGPEPGETRVLLENQNQDQVAEPEEINILLENQNKDQVAVHFKKEPKGTKVLLETRNPDRKLYLVVDCGDRHINITVHKVLEGGALKMLDNDTGYDLGGRFVDSKFKEFLRKIFSEVWREYEQNFPSEVQKMLFEFIHLTHLDEDVQISCPDTLRDRAQRKKHIETFFASVEGASWENGVIKISRDKLRSFFDHSLQRITEIIRNKLNKKSNVGFIVLVGGFAESQMLRQFITDQFGHQYKVLCPLRPQEAVLKGAVELGRNPELVLFD